MTTPDDLNDFAQQFQQAADGGGFNPFSLFTGENRFHSIFLAPFSPSMRLAVEQFLHDGSGPLSGLVQQFAQSGLSPSEAAARARELLSQAQGMCVVVLANDQGLSTVPQLFFGHLENNYRDQVVALCGEQFGDAEALRRALEQLAEAAKAGAQGPQLFASAEAQQHGHAYWVALAQDLVDTLQEGVLPGNNERLRDLAHWIAAALNYLHGDGVRLDGNELLLCARAHIVAGEIDGALRHSAALLADYEPEDEELLALLESLVQVAISHGEPQRAWDFLEQQRAAIDPILGGIYELELARFRALAAGGPDTPALLTAAQALAKADRKSYRHDLNREPLWRVTGSDYGDTLSVNQAAELLERSINFVAKRLEAGTIPYVQHDADERRIPRRSLEAWKAMMDEHRLID